MPDRAHGCLRTCGHRDCVTHCAERSVADNDFFDGTRPTIDNRGDITFNDHFCAAEHVHRADDNDGATSNRARPRCGHI
ncbi:MAG: hypothetical protein ACR2N9_10085, partial [Acidimicrobiia bacterium]